MPFDKKLACLIIRKDEVFHGLLLEYDFSGLWWPKFCKYELGDMTIEMERKSNDINQSFPGLNFQVSRP